MAELVPDGAEVQQLADELSCSMTAQYGPVLGSSALLKVLCYPSAGAFQQAIFRGTVPVPTFRIDNRRGRFALTRDVALWLSRKRAQVTVKRN